MLKWQRHHATKRIKTLEELESSDVVITTYQTLVSEFRKHADELQLMFSVNWRRVILDEGKPPNHTCVRVLLMASAHDIRDHSRITARAMHHLQSTSRWALTGTPIQNSLLDVASLYRFLKVYPYIEPTIFKDHVRRICKSQAGADVVPRIKRLLRCIMLRRSISTITLPERSDLICRLDFSEEEAELYNRAKIPTLQLLNDAISGTQNDTGQLNVLPWINTLRMICNLGVRAKTPLAETAKRIWDDRAAQEMFNSLVIADAAICKVCSTDLGVVATEVADQVSAASNQPQLSSCSYLLCGPCLEKFEGHRSSCGHLPPHPVQKVSTLSSSLSASEDHVTTSRVIPTKVQALIQDLKQHIDEQKW